LMEEAPSHDQQGPCVCEASEVPFGTPSYNVDQ
jgi:hypothetical protein